MEQQYSQVPPDLNGWTMFDSDLGVVSQWSQGAQRIVAVPTQPTLTEPWHVTAWGITLQGALATNFPGLGTSPFGRLGKLLGGPIVGEPLRPGTATQPFAPIPQGALPTIETLWDGSQDPPFPFLNPVTAPLPYGGTIAATFPLSQPIELNVGNNLGFGLWLTPMIANNIEVIIANAVWNISWDIGQPADLTRG